MCGAGGSVISSTGRLPLDGLLIAKSSLRGMALPLVPRGLGTRNADQIAQRNQDGDVACPNDVWNLEYT